MRLFRVSENVLEGEGTLCVRMRGVWFLKRDHWYECSFSGEAGLVWMDSMNVHELVEIV